MPQLGRGSASAFIGVQIGSPVDHIEDHAAYISSWLTALEDNASAFLTAAAKARTAADYVPDLMGVTAVATGAVDETPVDAAVVEA